MTLAVRTLALPIYGHNGSLNTLAINVKCKIIPIKKDQDKAPTTA